ncbi:hypothetical protein [Hyphomicrobium sp. D-2]|uniref:hypothetical protein n=1 Tax=Hyphomicrobium sp. D-2 TaxID=3041621 RepID=UPI0024583670|nr:hypothetical protein [Hyphomicrobium sp. D-2]MDH4982164.1 hypothetical protein [Hyphomicrobium sp. D-2]
MDERTRLLIAEAFPTVPEELATAWLAPFVKKLGPPQNSEGWLNFLLDYPLEFWRQVRWAKQQINLRDTVSGGLSSNGNATLGAMESGYYLGVPNNYAIEIPDGWKTTERALEYLREQGTFPSPPVLLETPQGYEIMDGNHRMLAYVHAIRVVPPEAGEVQEVWIGRTA